MQMELAQIEIDTDKIVSIKKWCPNCKRFYYWNPDSSFLNHCPICLGIAKPKPQKRIQRWIEKQKHREG